MSSTELHIGKLTKVVKMHESETINEIAKRILNGNGKHENPNESLIEQLHDFKSETYFVYNGELYEADDTDYDEGGDICEAFLSPDGSINYVLQFYNGGTYMGEMMEDALKNMKIR